MIIFMDYMYWRLPALSIHRNSMEFIYSIRSSWDFVQSRLWMALNHRPDQGALENDVTQSTGEVLFYQQHASTISLCPDKWRANRIDQIYIYISDMKRIEKNGIQKTWRPQRYLGSSKRRRQLCPVKVAASTATLLGQSIHSKVEVGNSEAVMESDGTSRI